MKKLIILLLLLSSFTYADSFPEPMVYDLVRGLDNKKGEVEINSLMLSDKNATEMSPEIEFSLKDGLAFELEAPMAKGKVEALKFGSQLTLFQTPSTFLLGIQGLYEKFLYQDREDFSLTGVIDYRFDPGWTLVTIVGGRSALYGGNVDHSLLVFNLSIFYELNDQIFVGLENDKNFYFIDRPTKISSIPQVSIRLTETFKIQTGVGYTWQEKNNLGFFTRFIGEF